MNETAVAKRTQFVMLLDDIEQAIDTQTASGKGQHLRRRPLLRELLEWVVLGRSADDVAVLRKDFPRRLRQMSSRQIQVETALHVVQRYRVSYARAARLATLPEVRVASADLQAVARLARRVGDSLGDLDRNTSQSVRACVDAYFERLVVAIDRRALEDMLLAALEAYVVPRPGKGQKYTEVFGYCFGTCRDMLPESSSKRFRRILSVNRIVTQLRGRATASEVFPSEKSERLHLDVASRFFEHLTLLGDYHTHPWASLSKLRQRHGWRPSSADRSHIESWAANARRAGGYPRFSLIAAIARGGKKGRSTAREAKNRVRFCVNGLYVVLAAYRLQSDDTYDEEVSLLCPGVADVVGVT